MKPLRGFRFAGAYLSIEMNALRAKFAFQLIINFSFSIKMGYFAKLLSYERICEFELSCTYAGAGVMDNNVFMENNHSERN